MVSLWVKNNLYVIPVEILILNGWGNASCVNLGIV